MELENERRAYRFWYFIFIPLVRIFYPVTALHTKRVPEGRAVICANHSNWVDPFLIAYALKGHQLHMMAKAELFHNKILNSIFTAIGSFPVHREKADLNAIKTAMRYLSQNEKIGIFPEGTRTAHDFEVKAKVGALKIAEKMNAPIVPLWIPRKKSLFTPFAVVVGEPYMINPEHKKMTNEEYEAEAAELMKKIALLQREAAWKN